MKKKPKKAVKSLRVILIDATNCEVRSETWPKEEVLDRSQKWVGGYVTTAAQLDTGESIMVDDEGLLKDHEDMFVYGTEVFAGNGVVWGATNRDGDTLTCKVTSDQVKRLIRFTSRSAIEAIMRGA